MNASELTGAALDWAVAKCEGKVSDDVDDFRLSVPGEFAYSTEWAQGGPITERESISTMNASVDGKTVGWVAEHGYGPTLVQGSGATPLIAAMRCWVASKLGGEIYVPEELR